MGTTDVHNLFESILLIVSSLIAVRALSLYGQIRGERLFILGLAMSIIALTSIVGLIGDNALFGVHASTNWFKYIGQTISFLFVFLSTIRSTNSYLYQLMRWHIAVSSLLLLLLLLVPIFPPFPDPTTEAIVSGSRGVICFFIFYCYMSLFMGKETRYALLMSLAFSLLAFGYILILPPLFISHQDILSDTGNVLRIIGLSVLLLASLCG